MGLLGSMSSVVQFGTVDMGQTGHIVLGLPRMIDKARGVVAGTPGEYKCPWAMDEATLNFLAISSDAFLDVIREGADDERVVTFVRATMCPRTEEEIRRFRTDLLFSPPREDEQCQLFERLQAATASDGCEVDTFAKAIAADEGWAVPDGPTHSNPGLIVRPSPGDW